MSHIRFKSSAHRSAANSGLLASAIKIGVSRYEVNSKTSIPLTFPCPDKVGFYSIELLLTSHCNPCVAILTTTQDFKELKYKIKTQILVSHNGLTYIA